MEHHFDEPSTVAEQRLAKLESGVKVMASHFDEPSTHARQMLAARLSASSPYSSRSTRAAGLSWER